MRQLLSPTLPGTTRNVVITPAATPAPSPSPALISSPIPPGGAVLQVDGRTVPVDVQPRPGDAGLLVQGDGWEMTLDGLNRDGQPLGINPQGALPRSGQVPSRQRLDHRARRRQLPMGSQGPEVQGPCRLLHLQGDRLQQGLLGKNQVADYLRALLDREPGDGDRAEGAGPEAVLP